MQGFKDFAPSEVCYISPKAAIQKFQYLWQLDRNLYVRSNTQLTDEELTQYEMMLTVPKDASSFYVRVMSPLLVWEKDEGSYLINGNSRLASIERLLDNPKITEIADIPYTSIKGDLSLELIERLQYDANDTTRKNNALEKLRRIQAFIDKSVAKGMTGGAARRYATEYFGVGAQRLSDAKALCTGTLPEALENLLESDTATTDAVVLMRQVSNSLKVEPELIISEVLAASKNGKITQGKIKDWRKSYTEKNKNSPQVLIQGYKDETPLNTLEQFLEAPPKELLDIEPVTNAATEDTTDITQIKQLIAATTPAHNNVLCLILSNLLETAPEPQAATIHPKLLGLLQDLITNDSPELLTRIKSALSAQF